MTSRTLYLFSTIIVAVSLSIVLSEQLTYATLNTDEQISIDNSVNLSAEEWHAFAQTELVIPEWIKVAIEAWLDGKTTDAEFVAAMQFLIKEGILIIPLPECEDMESTDLLCPQAHDLIIQESRYVSFEENSPFYELSNNNSYFHREDFEDGSLNVPGVTFSDGGVFGPSDKVDSVDKDDGKVDGTCPGCYSYQVDKQSNFFFITFDKSKLPEFPTHAGIVVTDSTWGADCSRESQILIDVIDSNGSVVDSKLYENIDFGETATTVNDVFFGAIYEDGIKQIRISIDCGSMEVDHLQYGRQ